MTVAVDGPAGRDDHGTLDLTTGAFRAPGVVAPRSEWIAYAVFRGWSVADAESLTKADLVEKLSDKAR